MHSKNPLARHGLCRCNGGVAGHILRVAINRRKQIKPARKRTISKLKVMIKEKLGYQPYPGKVITQPSLTVPDQTMSLRQIMQRYARGLPIDGNRQLPLWEGEEGDGIEMKHLDPVDREEYIRSKEEELNMLRIKLNRKKRRKKASDGSEDNEGSQTNEERKGDNERKKIEGTKPSSSDQP